MKSSKPEMVAKESTKPSARIQMIILDLSLPDLTGVEVTSLLKQAPKTLNIPIIVLSVWSASKWKEKALQAGASVYLLKPPSPDVLRETINRVKDVGFENGKTPDC
jgi:CheY-like chemotaxis protein